MVGGGDSAMEEALFLASSASAVTIVHRRDEFRASKIMERRAIDHPDLGAVEQRGGGGAWGFRCHRRQAAPVLTGETTTVDADGFFVAIGHRPNTDILSGQVELDSIGYVVLEGNGSTATSVEGVFAAGDVADPYTVRLSPQQEAGAPRRIDAERWLAEQNEPVGCPVYRAHHPSRRTMGEHSITVTDQTFEDAISGETPVLVDFWAEWCSPCRMVAPVLDEIGAEYAEKITIAKLNVDENPQTAASYDVMSIPTMIVFQEGIAKKRIVGARPKANMVSELSEFLA